MKKGDFACRGHKGRAHYRGQLERAQEASTRCSQPHWLCSDSRTDQRPRSTVWCSVETTEVDTIERIALKDPVCRLTDSPAAAR
jgi:hypothetical protein